ncbi:MAG: LysM peptidoglycan-binding domain-containing protein [Anaerolineae bacterium]|nr:LysM peptidoglycan-binding domain-containing protein [Anaerolineae bacterium]
MAGDTLVSISQQFGVSVADIMAANGLTDPNNLTVGQQLIIPAPGSVTPVAPAPPTGSEQVYTVRPGDNLFRIGLQYGCTVDQLSAYNNIPAPYTIFVGDQILIPPDC